MEQKDTWNVMEALALSLEKIQWLDAHNFFFNTYTRKFLSCLFIKLDCISCCYFVTNFKEKKIDLILQKPVRRMPPANCTSLIVFLMNHWPWCTFCMCCNCTTPTAPKEHLLLTNHTGLIGARKLNRCP